MTFSDLQMTLKTHLLQLFNVIIVILLPTQHPYSLHCPVSVTG
jgi:hypothetical protein